MDTVNKHLASLETQVAELIDILLESFTSEDVDDTETVTRGLERYAQQLARIAATAETAEWIGLSHVCMLYQEAVARLAFDIDGLVRDRAWNKWRAFQ